VHSATLAILGYYIVGFSIIRMICDVGGYATPYYAGLNLVFVAFGVLYPLRVRTIMLHCVGLYLIYILGVMMLDPTAPYKFDPTLAPPNDPAITMYRLFLSNNSFVLSSLFIIIIASAVGSNLRFREYKLRMELEDAKRELQRSNEMLEITLARKHRDLIENLQEKKLVEEMKNKLEEQLIQSQKLEAIGRLAGGVAHDFNNILTVIKVNSDLLLMRMEEQNAYRKKVSEIRHASERAAALIRQLLAFSRKQMLQPRNLDLNEIIFGMGEMLNRLIGEDIDLGMNLADDLGKVKADPSQIEQVVMNLVVNSRDAMPKGGYITIQTKNVYFDRKQAVSREGSLREGDYVLMSVSDTGEGMDKEIQSHIFEPFYTTKDVGKGTGLGLSTVYGIIRQSDGAVTVYSEIGQGTSFKVYLPCYQNGNGHTPQQLIENNIQQGEETVLLVEDDESVRKIACEILSENGYKILEALSTDDALDICKTYSGKIDLLLTDVIMPLMSGAELSKQIVGMRPNIHVLYMSGYADDAISRHGVIEKGVLLLDKPFTAYSLTQKVREAIDVQ
ncbi:response regulator, partial [bacterium]|nr:response regulator [bacterium]